MRLKIDTVERGGTGFSENCHLCSPDTWGSLSGPFMQQAGALGHRKCYFVNVVNYFGLQVVAGKLVPKGLQRPARSRVSHARTGVEPCTTDRPKSRRIGQTPQKIPSPPDH